MELVGITNYPAFLGAAILLNVTPGSDTMYVLAHTVARGKRAGILSALGISTGGLIHTLGVVCGLSALIAAEPAVFLTVKVAGALFLIYLGISAFRENSLNKHVETIKAQRSGGKIYLSGVLTNVLNPKVAIFFLAFLPQFIQSESDSIPLAFLLLGCTFLTTGTLWSFILVSCASALNRKIDSNQTLLVRASGVIFIALGLSVLLSRV